MVLRPNSSSENQPTFLKPSDQYVEKGGLWKQIEGGLEKKVMGELGLGVIEVLVLVLWHLR